MNFDAIRCEVERESDGSLWVIAYSDEWPIAGAETVRDGDRLQLCDIKVKVTVERRWPLGYRILQRLHLWAPPQLRGHGIGSKLLDKLIDEARSAGVREVWGIVVAKDLRNTPHLLDWYTHQGFAIQPPDAEAKAANKYAVKKIVRSLSS